MTEAVKAGGKTYSITYLSQCIALRQSDASDDGTYPFVAQHYVEAARPGVQIATTVIYYGYPYVDLELKFEVAVRGRPDVIVLEVPASPVAYGARTGLDLRRFPSGIRAAHQRFHYLRELNVRLQLPRGVGQLVHIADVSLRGVLNGPLRGLVRRYPMPTFAEYESLVEATIARLVAKSAATLVLAGPAGFSEAGSGKGYVDGAAELYDAVNEMARRIAARHKLPFIDRVAVAGEGGTSFFRSGSSIHYSPNAHRMLGRFVGDLLLGHGIL